MIVEKFKKEYIVKSYEADCHGSLRLLTLFNLLQDAAAENADLLNLGFEKCGELGLTWFGSDYYLEIERLPRMGERFIIETWPAETKLYGAIRDFLIYDANNNIIARISSQWVLIDLTRRRPALLSKYFPDYQGLSERALPISFMKIKEAETFNREDKLKVRFDDIDINNHVNNSIYPLWASECVDPDFRLKHTPCEIEINFKKPAVYGEDIVVLTNQNHNETFHSIRENNKETELARCRLKWRDVTSK